MSVVDAHVHVWDLDRCTYPWLGRQHAPIDRTLTLHDLEPELGVDAGGGGDAVGGTGRTGRPPVRVVLVQAADDAAETAYLLDVAHARPDLVAGVVGWVPLDRPDDAHATIDALRGTALVGVRTLVHDQPDPDWVVRPAVDAGLAVLAAAGLPYDHVTADPEGLRHLPGIAERHPGLRLVIDHLGKPPVGGTASQRARWRDLLAAVAAHPRAHAKVSGLYAATGPLDGWTTDAVRPFVDDALDLFGADRLMLGSDWPVCVLAGGRARTWRALTGMLAGRTATERDALLGGTATRVYALPPA